DLMLLLARTTPIDQGEKRSDGLSTFIVDLRAAGGRIRINPIETLMNHATTEVFFDDLEVTDDALLGIEGEGFRQILVGWNAERKFRETRLYKVAPVPNNLALAYLGQNVLGMPRSY